MENLKKVTIDAYLLRIREAILREVKDNGGLVEGVKVSSSGLVVNIPAVAPAKKGGYSDAMIVVDAEDMRYNNGGMTARVKVVIPFVGCLTEQDVSTLVTNVKFANDVRTAIEVAIKDYTATGIS